VAGGGIGGAVVARLLRTGANVVGADLSGKRVAGTAQATQDLPGKLEVVKSDLTTEDGVAQVVETALETFGSVQGVANVAGGMVNINQDVYDVPLRTLAARLHRDVRAERQQTPSSCAARSEPHFFATLWEDRQRRLPGRVREPAGGSATSPTTRQCRSLALTQTISVQSGARACGPTASPQGLCSAPASSSSSRTNYLQRHLDYTTMGDLASAGRPRRSIAFSVEPAVRRGQRRDDRVSAACDASPLPTTSPNPADLDSAPSRSASPGCCPARVAGIEEITLSASGAGLRRQRQARLVVRGLVGRGGHGGRNR